MDTNSKEKPQEFKLIVNRQEKPWPQQFITGEEILKLADSPPDWVVNLIVPGSGEDPEIGAKQPVDLSLKADPEGVKKFLTRKPRTNPGHV